MDTLELAPSSRRLICPRERYEKGKDEKMITVNGQVHHITESSYYISDTEDGKFKHLDHSLRRLNRIEGVKYLKNYDCWACQNHMTSEFQYACNYCRNVCHKECVETPSMFRSPDHPKHSLQLLWFPGYEHQHTAFCFSCRKRNGIIFYYCSICDFLIHPSCAKNSTPLTIDNPKRHGHTLHYFPRMKSTLTCDVCALEDDTDYLYVCLLCDFVVHKRCVYSPYVIKVSRHNHRLAFTSNLPYKEWTNCGVCRAKVDVNYGQYSCTKGCVYAMHSKCAMRSDVSDGKELQGEPEEAYENVSMYEEKGDGVIQHLSHPHHQLRLRKKIQSAYDVNKHCEACMLPFYDDGNLYQCMPCDFVLHESCAYIPRVKEYMLHIHPLVLKFDNTTSRGRNCRKCYRFSCGFSYECSLQTCEWVIDTLCASICEPFDHHAHPHPLFITCDEKTFKECSICQFWTEQPLNCIECDFVLCFGCATLPHKKMYENDEHLLNFSYKKDVDDDEFYECEICEEDINSKNGLYACKDCGLTLHINCLLGKDPYLKPGQSLIMDVGGTIRALSNTLSTRPICKYCKRRCSYKIKIESSEGLFCSAECCHVYLKELDARVRWQRGDF